MATERDILIQNYKEISPQIASDVFVAQTAAIIGDVHIGAGSSIWFGAVLRGDVFPIRIGESVSIQDNAVIHVTSGQHATTVGNRVTVGHAAVLHGCTIDDSCIVGMGAIVLDQAHVHRHCIVGAGALVTSGTHIPEGYLAVGTPARPKRKLTRKELDWIESSADHYVSLAQDYRDTNTDLSTH